MKITELKVNERNPRYITKTSMERLKERIQDFPKMMKLRPIVVDQDNTILGGNMRYRALVELGYKEIPEDWVKRAEELTEEEQRKFIIGDNVGFGEWDMDTLANEWEVDELDDWGIETFVGEEEEEIKEPEVKFSEFLDEEHNYVVLYFDNRIDWLQALTEFNLEAVSAKRSNGKEWSKGVGRVVNGTQYLKSKKK